MSKKWFTRGLSALLVMVMLFTTVPVSVFATNGQGYNSGVSTESYATGANSVGSVLAEEIEEAQEEAEASADSPVCFSALSVDEFTAAVNFETNVNANLVVAIYTEDGKHMLTSGMLYVEPEDTSVIVEIDEITLPQYYLVKAFLLDAQTNAPLCSSFSDDTHTKAYIDFMALDVNDFDEEKVINLDENEDNNFIVVSDNAEIIYGNETENKLVSADYDSSTYVFENINGEISNLQVGDLFYYQSEAGEYELIKVKSISINGSRATIIGDDMETEEAFDCIKIDTRQIQEPQSAKAPALKSAATNVDKSFNFIKGEFEVSVKKNDQGKIRPQITKKKVQMGVIRQDDTIDNDPGSSFKPIAKLGVDASLNATIVVYIHKSYKNIDVRIGGDVQVYLEIGVGFEKEISLGKFEGTFYKLINIGVALKFKVEAKVALIVTGTLTFKLGFKVDNDGHFKGIKEGPKFDPDVKVEGELYIGFVVEPYITIIHERVLKVSLPIDVGARATATLSTKTISDVLHDCDYCIAGNIKIELNVSAVVDIANIGISWIHHKESAKLFGITWKLTDFYYSLTHKEFGWGLCPYIKAPDDPNTANDNLTGKEKLNDIIKFGSYPQTRVTKKTTVDALNSLSLSWKSYGYYSGNVAIGSMVQSDYMKYADVMYNNNKYRAVKFTQYRPYWTGNTSSSSSTYQDDYGYYTNTTYWFKYEPLKWRVLDPARGLVLSETCIDSQAYSDTFYEHNGNYYNDASHTNYASDYETSSIREWLNDDFYNTAFNSTQQEKFDKTTLDNSSPYNNNQFGSASTTDKIFLMSYNEMLNPAYGFSTSSSSYDVARQAKSTDYAKSQGCWQSTSSSNAGNAFWFLRSPGCYGFDTCNVDIDGYVVNNYYVVSSTYLGVRPALRLNLTTKSSKAPAMPKKAAASKAARAMTAAEAIFDFSYNLCIAGNDYVLLNVTNYGDDFELTNESLQFIDQLTADENGMVSADFEPKEKLNNSTTLLVGDFGNGVEARVMTKCNHENTTVDEVAATCTTDGCSKTVCSDCGFVLDETVLPATGHTSSDWITDTDSTCIAEGTKHKECIVCHETLETGTIEKKPHTPSRWIIDTDSTCTEEGVKVRECTVCHETLETAVMKKKQHVPDKAVREDEIASTCTQTGTYNEVVYCADCGEKLSSKAKTIELISHTSSEWIIDTEPTCIEEGTKHKECTVCHEVLETEAIDKVEHTPSEWLTDKEPTCIEEGTKHKGCTVCHETLETEAIEMVDHTPETAPVKAPTCAEEGLTEGIICSICGEMLTERETIPATGNHQDNDHNGRCDTCNKDTTEGCDCRCHKGGFAGFIYKIVRIFWKIFKTNQICQCGVSHY